METIIISLTLITIISSILLCIAIKEFIYDYLKFNNAICTKCNKKIKFKGLNDVNKMIFYCERCKNKVELSSFLFILYYIISKRRK